MIFQYVVLMIARWLPGDGDRAGLHSCRDVDNSVGCGQKCRQANGVLAPIRYLRWAKGSSTLSAVREQRLLDQRQWRLCTGSILHLCHAWQNNIAILHCWRGGGDGNASGVILFCCSISSC
jgi:hypothetical protein